MQIISNMLEANNYFQLESSNWFDLIIINNIYFIFFGSMEILIGYNIYSYIRGVSNKAQRYFIIFGFAILLWDFFSIIPTTLLFITHFPNNLEVVIIIVSFFVILTIIFSFIIRNKYVSE